MRGQTDLADFYYLYAMRKTPFVKKDIDFELYFKENHLDFEKIEDNVYGMVGQGIFLTMPDREYMFYDWLEINTSKAEEELIKKYKIDYLVYEFGGRKFFADTADLPRAYGHDLRYIGKSTVMDENFVHLGIHSGYELLNGSRSYEDYCKKAKFYGHKALGIAEKGTMAGCLEFQSVCKKNDIKPILGASYQIVSEIEEGLEYTAKFYVQNEDGWHSLLMLNKEANVDSLTRKVPESVVFANSEGLFCVLNTGAMSKETTEIFVSYKNAFKERVFFQFEAIEYVSDEVDRDYLLKLKNYIENYQKTIEPILINDSYYLEHEHASVKRNLNKIRDITTENRSDFYHYKTSFQTKEFLQNIFSDKEMFETLFNKAVSNAYDVADRCNFKIDTDGFKLPLYKPAPGVQYWDAQDHLKTMVRERFKEVIKRDNLTESEIIKYRVRFEDEIDILAKVKGYNGANGCDYMLILEDIVSWCAKNDILTGVGRGSAAGSLVSYVLGITQVNPIKNDLYFERFLNEGRIGGSFEEKVIEVLLENGECFELKTGEKNTIEIGHVVKSKLGVDRKVEKVEEKTVTKYISGKLPDIDVDFQSSKIEDVKDYMKEKYGHNNVVHIGTATTFKVKSAFKDIARVFNVPTETANRYSKNIEKYIEKSNKDELDMSVFFKFATDKSNPLSEEFYDFMQDNVEMFNLISLFISQNSALSTHACAMLILPESDKKGNKTTAFDFIPIRRDGDKLISEWGGSELDDCGFLKEDILSLGQLDKFAFIFKKLKAKGIDINFLNIDYEDKKALKIFTDGILQDVFQFSGLSDYIKRLEPNNLAELVAATSLYRPGPMDSGAHEAYINLKHGEIEPSYDVGCEDITKDTYGLLVYQEQIMNIVSRLGGLSLKDADTVRAGLGKKQLEKVKKFKDRFINGAVNNYEYLTSEAEELWGKIEMFASYSFNKSHAQCYTTMSYVCAYLKAHYPVEFYLASLTECKDDRKSILPIIAEIKLQKLIELKPPSINHSTDEFEVVNNSIYWSIQKIKGIGEVALQAIIEERNLNGKFFDINEFLSRVGKKVKSNQIVNLILAGAFDDVQQIKDITGRYLILKKYQEILGNKSKFNQDDYPENLIHKQYFWEILQKDITGLGYIDYKEVIATNIDKNERKAIKIIDETNVLNEHNEKDSYCVGGTILEVAERSPKSGSGKTFGSVELDINGVQITLMVWNETWLAFGAEILKSKGSIIVLTNCNCKVNSFKGSFSNGLYTTQSSKVKII